MSEDLGVLMIDGQQVSMADLAGISMDSIEEVRFELFPSGSYQWKGLKAGFVKRGDALGVAFDCECVEVVSTIDPNVDLEKTVGKEFGHWVKIDPEDVPKSLGRAKAFCVDIGMNCQGQTLDTLFDQFASHYFLGVVVHRKDKNDPDTTWVNFGNKKGQLGPVAQAPQAEAAPAA